MKAHLEHVFQRDGWNVWLYERTPEGIRIFDSDGDELDVVPDHTVAEPSFFLRTDALEALLAAVEGERGVRPPNVALAEHRDDAVKVRDRLLALVEHQAMRR